MRHLPDFWSADLFPIADADRYEILGEIARGGLGRILRARDRVLGRDVAIKELLKDNPDALERFLKEALITSRLQHPSIVPIYDVGRWRTGAPFYAMKLVQGRALDVIINEARSIEDRLEMLPRLIAVADAIGFAHRHRVLHRDIKPANILIGDFGETLVIDWGLMKDLDGRMTSMDLLADSQRALLLGQTVAGQVVGTPVYMPPEQAAAEGVDERSDVYSIGAVLYHLLSGHTPYKGETGPEVLRYVVSGPPKPLVELAPELPHDLVAIVEKAMGYSPDERYPTARELAEDLRRFEAGQLVAAREYSRAQLVRRWIRRRIATVSIAAAALLLVAVAGIASIVRVIEERDRAELAMRAAEALNAGEMERADELVLVEARRALDRDPTASMAWLSRLSPRSKGWNRARIIAEDARERGIARVYRGPEAPVTAISFADDGRELEVLSTGEEPRKIAIDGAGGTYSKEVLPFSASIGGRSVIVRDPDGEELGTYEAPGEIARVAVSRDGAKIVLAIVRDPRVILMDRETLETRELIGHTQAIEALAFSRDGRRIASASADHTIRVWDVMANAHERIIAHGPALHPWVALPPDGKALAIAGGGSAITLADFAAHDVRKLKTRDGSDDTVAFERAVFSAAGTSLAIAGRNLMIVDLVKRSIVLLPSRSGALVRAAAFGADGSELFIVERDGGARSVNLADRSEHVICEGLPLADGSGAMFAHDGSSIAVPGLGQGVSQICETATGRITALDGGIARALAFAHDAHLVAGAGDDRSVRVYRVPDGRVEMVLDGHESGIASIAFSPDGAFVAVADGRVVKVWELATKKSVALRGHGAPITGIDFSPDGTRIASTAADGTMRIWDRASGESRTVRVANSASPASPRFAHGGRKLVCTAGDRSVRIFANDLPVELEKLAAWTATVTNAVIGGDGSLVSE